MQSFDILLVDDEPGDLDLVKAALDEGRFRPNVVTAGNGTQALAVLRAAPTPPHLVLLDLNMPLMNGWDVLKAMKADPALARIPVVVLTTSETDRDLGRSYDLGAAGFVTKPVDVDQLFRIIHGIEDYWFATVRAPGRIAGR